MLSEKDVIFDKNILPEALEEDDPALLLSFYQLYLDHSVSAWHQAQADARDLKWSEVRVVAHSLKSSSLGVGAISIGNMMAMIEKKIDAETATLSVIDDAADLLKRTSVEMIHHMTTLQAQVDPS